MVDPETISENLKEPLFAVDADGTIRYTNQRLLDIAELTREDAVGSDYARIDATVDSGFGDLRDAIEAVARGDASERRIEVSLSGADSSAAPRRLATEARVSPLTEDGSRVGSLVVFREISVRRERERELRDLVAKFEALVSALPDVVTVKTRAGYEQEAFDSAVPDRLLAGTDASGGNETPLSEIFPDETAEQARAVIERAIETGTIQSMEYQLAVPAGQRWFEAKVAPLEKPTDGEKAVVWVARDITDRKERQQELGSYETLFENTSDCIVETEFVDGEPVIQRANQAFEDVFGYTESELVGEQLDEMIVPADRTAEATAINERARDGERFSKEVTRETADGNREFLMRSVGFEDDRFYVVYTDITERKERERELRTTKRKLERSNEKLEQFAYVASHDLQEPLRMVSSYVDLIEAELGGDLDSETQEYLEFAVDGARRMQLMIDGLLQYSRVQTRAEPFEPVDAEAVATESRRDLELLREESGAEITVGSLPTVTADGNQLGQVFQNLLKNAIEHGPDGVSVTLTATEREDGTEFAIEDDGPGIPDHQRDDVFDLFEKGADSDGTGIGLAVCQQIVDRHGGGIRVESTVGEGTTVYVTIPDDPG